MTNYLTLENAKKEGFILENYFLRDCNEKINDLKDFKTLGFCKLVPMVYISNCDNKIHFEHITVFIEFENVLLRPYRKYNEKTFTFSLAESLYVRSFEHNLIQPNKVGKPTQKKLNEWVTYLQQIEALKTAKMNERNNKETEFLNKIKNSGLTVSHQSNDGKRGYIETKNFEFYFEIEDNGYITQKITLQCGNTIDNFLKLVQNENN